jgi:hypothetical protein
MKAFAIAALFSLLRIVALGDEPESTPKDRQLIEAAYRLRADEVKRLLADGAHMNARYGATGEDKAFEDPWILGYPMTCTNWTALLALTEASILPPPPRKVANTEEDMHWRSQEVAKIPEKEKEERRKLKQKNWPLIL